MRREYCEYCEYCEYFTGTEYCTDSRLQLHDGTAWNFFKGGFLDD